MRSLDVKTRCCDCDGEDLCWMREEFAQLPRVLGTSRC